MTLEAQLVDVPDDTADLMSAGGLNHDPLLGLLADSVDDLENVRKAMANRYRSLTQPWENADGETRGLNLSTEHPAVARAKALLDATEELEVLAVKNLEKHIQGSVFAGWVAREKGVGKKQAARLIAVLGDPYWNDLHNRPRTVSELWAYCGYAVHGGTAQRRTKGQVSNWSTVAKTRAFLIAEKTIVVGKGGKYNTMYYDTKAQLEDAVHAVDCVRCGPAGKPALAGSDLNPGHKDARAKRKVAKEILKDLWLESRKSYVIPEA